MIHKMRRDKVEKFSNFSSKISGILRKNLKRVRRGRGIKRYNRTDRNMRGEKVQREEIQRDRKKGMMFVGEGGTVLLYWQMDQAEQWWFISRGRGGRRRSRSFGY